MEINFSHIISFKVASYSAIRHYTRYLLEKLKRENNVIATVKKVEMFSILIEIVEAAL